MTIEEAIKHAEEVAEEHTKYNFYGGYESCDECASEHLQLAEWLKELKELKDFANFVAESIMEDDFEENGRFYAEVFCRRLNKLGVIRSENNKWVYDEEVKANADSN